MNHNDISSSLFDLLIILNNPLCTRTFLGYFPILGLVCHLHCNHEAINISRPVANICVCINPFFIYQCFYIVFSASVLRLLHMFYERIAHFPSLPHLLHYSCPLQYFVFVDQSCKFALRLLGPLMSSEAINDKFQKHLLEEANLFYGEFMIDLSKLIVSCLLFCHQLVSIQHKLTMCY